MFMETNPGPSSTGEKGSSSGEHLLPGGIGQALGWPEALLTLNTKDYLHRESQEKVQRGQSLLVVPGPVWLQEGD